MYAYFTITIPPYITFQLWCAYDIASSQWSSSLLSLLCHNSRTYDTLVELLYGIAGWPCLRIESETKRNVCVHLPYKIHMALALWMMDTRVVINFCVRPLGRKKEARQHSAAHDVFSFINDLRQWEGQPNRRKAVVYGVETMQSHTQRLNTERIESILVGGAQYMRTAIQNAKRKFKYAIRWATHRNTHWTESTRTPNGTISVWNTSRKRTHNTRRRWRRPRRRSFT